MSDFVQEQLLGYLLGALEDTEREALEENIRNDPRLRRELTRARRRLRCLRSAAGEIPTPPGLAERTFGFVFAQAGIRSEHPAPVAPKGVSFLPPLAESPGSWLAAHWSDAAATMGIFLAAALLLFPAIHRSRCQAQTLACQDNLRELGLALDTYSQHHGGYFPHVPANGRLAAAGIYAPTLRRDGLLPEIRTVLCPAAEAGRSAPRSIPALEELERANEEELPRLRQTMGGSYGYCLGYLEEGKYRGRRNLHRPHFALVADAPSQQPGHLSLHHGNGGQNVLFEDGRASFVVSARPNHGDDIFLNEKGIVAAGLSVDDAVIVTSDTPPLPEFSLVGSAR